MILTDISNSFKIIAMPKKDILISRRQSDNVALKFKDTITTRVVWHNCQGAKKPEPLTYYLIFLISDTGDFWSEVGTFDSIGSFISHGRTNCTALYYASIPIPIPRQ
jgi:hypothetical protein